MKAANSRSTFDRIAAGYPFLAVPSRSLASRLDWEALLRRLPAHERVFDERDACRGFPLVLAGSIGVAKSDWRGRRLRLYDVGPGDGCILTSSCLLSRREYPADGVTESDVELALIPAPFSTTLVDQFEPIRPHVLAVRGPAGRDDRAGGVGRVPAPRSEARRTSWFRGFSANSPTKA